MTSEEKYGIVKQPDPTCSAVDTVLSTLKRAENYLERPDYMNEDELRSAANEGLWYIDSAKAELEELRQVNMALRQWGEEWKQLAKNTVRDADRLEWLLDNGSGDLIIREWISGNAELYAIGHSRQDIDAAMAKVPCEK